MNKQWVLRGMYPLATIGVAVGCLPDDPVVEGMTAKDRGEEIYFFTGRCANCHGADGLGLSTFPGGPRIVGRTADDIVTQLVQECKDPAAIGCHPFKLRDISREQVADLATFLGTLGGGNAAADPGPICNDLAGTICTIAGNGVSGNIAGTQLARDQFLFWPQNVTMDPENRVVITDWNNYLIRRLTPSGHASCEAITDVDGAPGEDCPLVNIIGTSGLGDSCTTAAAPILGANALMNHPIGVEYDDLIEGEHNIILWGWHQWKIKYLPVNADGSTGEMHCVWGNGRGAGAENIAAGWDPTGPAASRFNLPATAVYDDARNFYISDQGNLRIRIIEHDDDDDFSSAEALVASMRNNNIRTYAGGLRDAALNFRRTAVDYSDSGDGGPVSEATFNVQAGFDAIPQFRLAIDRPRNLLYVADSENNRIRVIDLTTGIIDAFAGGGADVNGTTAATVRLDAPADVDLSADGNQVLISDSLNHCVRIVDRDTGSVRTVAGVCGRAGYAGDGGPALSALLTEPGGSYLAPDGSVYIADTLNHRIRRVNPGVADLSAVTAGDPAAAPASE